MKVLILGANGQIARVATKLFLEDTNASLTLYLRRSNRLKITPGDRVQVVEGDVTDTQSLVKAMSGHVVVYADLSGDMERQARTIVEAMHSTGVRRLIFISSMGIFGEIQGDTYSSVLDPYRDSARVIEASNLDYTIVRPAWLNDRDEIDYGTTRKREPFRNSGAVVSRKSVADLVVKFATHPSLNACESIGVHKGK